MHLHARPKNASRSPKNNQQNRNVWRTTYYTTFVNHTCILKSKKNLLASHPIPSWSATRSNDARKDVFCEKMVVFNCWNICRRDELSRFAQCYYKHTLQRGSYECEYFSLIARPSISTRIERRPRRQQISIIRHKIDGENWNRRGFREVVKTQTSWWMM